MHTPPLPKRLNLPAYLANPANYNEVREALSEALNFLETADKQTLSQASEKIVTFLSNPCLFEILSHPAMDPFWNNLCQKHTALFSGEEDFFDFPQALVPLPTQSKPVESGSVKDKSYLSQLIGLYQYINIMENDSPEEIFSPQQKADLFQATQRGCVDALKNLTKDLFFTILYAEELDDALINEVEGKIQKLALPFLTVGYLYAAQLHHQIAMKYQTENNSDYNLVRFFIYREKALYDLKMAENLQSHSLSQSIMQNAYGNTTITPDNKETVFIIPKASKESFLEINSIQDFTLQLEQIYGDSFPLTPHIIADVRKNADVKAQDLINKLPSSSTTPSQLPANFLKDTLATIIPSDLSNHKTKIINDCCDRVKRSVEDEDNNNSPRWKKPN